ncbi:MAG: hypothetical protein MI745_12640 [Pseudomonadales bacterium]|nr:hypothetical protein [Pseudomonadales bacterium]
MFYAEKIALISGLMVVLITYARYWQRTGDTRGLLVFWRREMALSVSEFKWQRAGITLLLVAVALRFVQALI